MHVLDTTACYATMREEPAMLSFLAAGRPGEFALVPPVVAEIEYCIQRLRAGYTGSLFVPVDEWDSDFGV